jgi:hypothetical protein
MGRSVEAGEAVYESDLIDIESLVFKDVDFPADAGILCLFSTGWRKGLFFDFGPLGPRQEAGGRRIESARLVHAYLRSQGYSAWSRKIGGIW